MNTLEVVKHDPRRDNFCLLVPCHCHAMIYGYHYMMPDYNTGAYYCPVTTWRS